MRSLKALKGKIELLNIARICNNNVHVLLYGKPVINEIHVCKLRSFKTRLIRSLTLLYARILSQRQRMT